ncbi:sensor histidine kinase [Salinarimonas rosea]|uniref:sensor histidine kinase n=1 Tax=Salinarimonas rosea TaxID=552063 RepID=UPI00048A771F|nr:histidine kinase dimerization/phosphoacceptor domain -containing protein [Salinarimonas rosea]
MLHRLTQTPPPERRDAADPAATRLPRFHRPAALPYFLVVAVLAPLVFFGFAAGDDWRTIESDARDRIVYIRDAVAEHAKRVFQTHELVAVSIRGRIGAMSWDEIASSAELNAYLGEIERNFEEVDEIWLVDDEGRVRASSQAVPVPALDVSDRPWFRAAGREGGALVVGPPEDEDAYFTRALPRLSGATESDFGGVIRIWIAPSYFTDFYESAYPDEGEIALVLGNGEVLVKHPPEARLPGGIPRAPVGAEEGDTSVAGYDPLDAGGAPQGGLRSAVFDGDATGDDGPRIQTWTRLGDLPVYAAFALDRASLEDAWRSRLAGYVAYFVPAVAALLFLGALAWRSHRALEEKVELRTRALSEAVAEKNQLLKEVHHRVKNNMQIVSSLIRMQERVHSSPDETIRRVQAMALVHDLIYSHGEFASVNLGAYVRRLSETLAGASLGGPRVRFAYDLDHVAVTLDRAMPFALILSEVLTNAMDHAFPDGEGHVTITLDRHDGRVELRVADDGRGFDPDATTGGFGLKLIRSLAVQLDAEVRFEPAAYGEPSEDVQCEEDGRGSVFVLAFPVAAPAHSA